MATYGWQPVDSSGNPVPEQNWNTPAEWDAFPLANPPQAGIVPGAADTALIGAGTINASTPFGSLSQAYPVTVDVTDSRTVATLGLGGLAVTGVNSSLQPIFGTPTVFPLVKVTGGTLHVAGDVVDNFVGTLSVPIPSLGVTETASHSFTGGGTIDLASHAALEVGGTAGAAVIVDFTDGAGDVLTLDGVDGAAPDAFAGTIDGFALGDTLELTALHTATHFVDAYTNGVLTVADSADPSVALALLDLPGSFTASSFALDAGAGGLAITIAPPPPPPAPGLPALTPGSDSGVSDTDDITNVSTPVFTGTAVAGSTVDLFDGTVLIGMGLASGSGTWDIESSPLAQGVHAISAEDVTAAGTSAASGTLTVTIDTTPPPAPGTPAFSAPGAGDTTTWNALTFTGSAEAGAIVTLFDGGTAIGTGTASAGGGWTITPGTLAVGAHAISADATDIAGNVGPHSGVLGLTIAATNTVDWVGGSGNFNTATEWEPQRVPGADDSAILDAAGTYTVTASANETLQSLTVEAGANLVVNAGTFTIGGGAAAAGAAVDVFTGVTFGIDRTPTQTVEIGGTPVVTGGSLQPFSNAGQLWLAGGTADLTADVTNSGTLKGYGTLKVAGAVMDNTAGTIEALDGLLTFDGAFSGGHVAIDPASSLELAPGWFASSGAVPVTFSGTGGLLLLGVTDTTGTASGVGDLVIDNFAHGDTIIVNGSVEGGGTFPGFGTIDNGSATLTFIEAGGTLGALTFAGGTSRLEQTTDADNDAIITVACFTAGTRILTARGEKPVEELCVGDRIPTWSGKFGPIVWVGHRPIECLTVSRPENVWPVRVRAGAFGCEEPERELWLSPDHAVFRQDVLIPIRQLINGITILQERTDAVHYFHVELDRHGVLYAEGLPSESYLDTNNRFHFENPVTTKVGFGAQRLEASERAKPPRPDVS